MQQHDIFNCAHCGIILPLAFGVEGTNWVCNGCGAHYHGVLRENASPEHLKNLSSATKAPSEDKASKSSVARALGQFRSSACQARGTSKTALPPRHNILCPTENSVSRQMDRQTLQGGGLLSVDVKGKAFVESLPRKTGSYDTRVTAKLIESIDDSFDQCSSLIDALEQEKAVDIGIASSISENTLMKAAEDLDLFVSLGINPPSDGYPGRHCLHVAMLAMSIGANLGWDEKTLIELGIGCLIHDCGMQRVKNSIHTNSSVIDSSDFVEIVKHPIYTFDLLSDHLNRVPAGSRMVAYQMHERCNGTGYPRGRGRAQIHELAKVAAVADVFIALVSPRPHRAGMMPYFAALNILHGAKNGHFESNAVRALLDTVSMYPLGSFVLLNDGRQGRVIRANASQHVRPVVEIWSHEGLENSPSLVDLSQTHDVEIKKPLVQLPAAEDPLLVRS